MEASGQVREIEAGHTLRVQATASFRLRWTRDEWQTAQDTDSVATGLGIDFVDIRISQAQRVPVRFTFLWSTEKR